jgi:hypothetical protein
LKERIQKKEKKEKKDKEEKKEYYEDVDANIFSLLVV